MPPEFRLQNVLNVRQTRVEMLEIELGKLLSARMEQQAHLERIQALHAQLLEHLSLALVGEIDLYQVNHIRADIRRLNDAVQAAMRSLAEMEEMIARKRQALVEAKQAEETLQTLKRNRIEQFNAEQARIETSTLDDLYISLAHRQRTLHR